MKEYPEIHQTGNISIEKSCDIGMLKNADFGIQIACDGRIWICINGEAVIRFQPQLTTKEGAK